MPLSSFGIYTLTASVILLCNNSVLAQNAYQYRLPPTNTPTYPGTAGLPSININDAHPGANAVLPSGSPVQFLQQSFPVPLKGSDADTFMPAGLLEKTLGPLAAPRRETHIY
jgi:hypothetical protein